MPDAADPPQHDAGEQTAPLTGGEQTAPLTGGEQTAPLDVEPTAQGLPPAYFPEGTPPSSRGGTVPVAVPVVLALVLGLAIGLIAGWLLPRPGSTDAGVAAPSAPAPASPAASPTPPVRLDPASPQPVAGGPDGTEQTVGLVLGETGPLVELFEDYVCPFCARLEAAAGQRLRDAALSGEYRLLVHPMAFLTEDSPRAANASACVYQHEDDATWVAFHEGLYARQDPSERVGQFSNEVLLELAEQVGADSPAVTRCVQQGTYQQWVAGLTQQAFDRGVRGTPTLAVDGTVTDAAPLLQQ
jgi:protein-disulfide isomerase